MQRAAMSVLDGLRSKGVSGPDRLILFFVSLILNQASEGIPRKSDVGTSLVPPDLTLYRLPLAYQA